MHVKVQNIVSDMVSIDKGLVILGTGIHGVQMGDAVYGWQELLHDVLA